MPDPKSSGVKNPDDNDLAVSGALPQDPQDGTRIVDDGPRLVTVRDMLRASYKNAITPRQQRACTTGHRILDRVTGGMRPAMTWVVMAETSFGKSSWTISAVDENLRHGAPVLIVSVEDPPELYGNRLLARRGKITATHIRDGKLTRDEERMAAEVSRKAEPLPVYLDAIDRSVEWVLKQVPEIVHEYKIRMVVVDYLQELYSDGRYQDQRVMYKWIARRLRACFKRLRVAGVIVSQITTKDGARPTKNDVRECRDVVHGTEHVVIGYEPEKPMETKTAGIIEAGTKCFIVDKNKDGPKGVVRLNWDERTASFYDEPDPQYEGMKDLGDRMQTDSFEDLFD